MNELISRIVGVDPAFRNGGFWTCVFEPDTRVHTFLQFPHVLAFDRYCAKLDGFGRNVFFVVENSNLEKFTFYTHKTASGVLLTAEQAKRTKCSPIPKQELLSISRNVGANQAASEYACIAVKEHFGQAALLELSPKQKGRKYTEMEFSYFVAQDRAILKGYNNLQDQRDAYKLAHQGLDHLKLVFKWHTLSQG